MLSFCSLPLLSVRRMLVLLCCGFLLSTPLAAVHEMELVDVDDFEDEADNDPCAGSALATCRVECADFPDWVGPFGRGCEKLLSTYGRAVGAQVKSKVDGSLSSVGCCKFGGGRRVAIQETAAVIPARGYEDVALWVPVECRRFVATKFPTLESLVSDNKGSSLGQLGGHWSACTHLQVYGMNLAVFFARWLAFGLRPRSVLEFGCGLGTTADFLARHVPGGTRVTCVEPEPMLSDVFAHASRPAPLRPVQLAVDVFEKGLPELCAAELFSKTAQFELVLSLEVAEHLAPERVGLLVAHLARATSKYLVFSAARPAQGGTGHVDGSMFPREWYIDQFERQGLTLLPHLTESLRFAAYPERAYDFGTNIIAMGAPGIEDRLDVPDIFGDCELYPHQFCTALQNLVPKEILAAKREGWVRGQLQALWPELDLVLEKLKSHKVSCG